MWRTAVLALVLCAGCAVPRDNWLIQDSLFGDVYSWVFDAGDAKGTAPPAATLAAPTSGTMPAAANYRSQ
jgi:hypothetical protein